MNNDKVQKIKEVYQDFKNKIADIKNRKTTFLKTYRTKLEGAKISEIKNKLNELF